MAVLVRHDGEVGLQGLRTAISLALGDRPPALFLFGPATGLLAAADGEISECVHSLTSELAVPIRVEGRDGDRGALLREAGDLALAQVF